MLLEVNCMMNCKHCYYTFWLWREEKKINKLSYLELFYKNKKKGSPGFEPGTYGFAIHRSTTELWAHL